MNIKLLVVGKTSTTHLDSAICDYQERLTGWVKIHWQIVPTSNIDKESEHILRLTDGSGLIVLLDERGDKLSTPQLAHYVETLQNTSTKQIIFVIGGAHGVNDAVREKADQIWKVSDLIFPHELVRLVLVEQLYRAYDINHGGKYHHS